MKNEGKELSNGGFLIIILLIFGGVFTYAIAFRDSPQRTIAVELAEDKIDIKKNEIIEKLKSGIISKEIAKVMIQEFSNGMIVENKMYPKTVSSIKSYRDKVIIDIESLKDQ